MKKRTLKEVADFFGFAMNTNDNIPDSERDVYEQVFLERQASRDNIGERLCWDIMTQRQVCMFLHVSEPTLMSLHLPFFKIGKRRFFLKEDILKWARETVENQTRSFIDEFNVFHDVRRPNPFVTFPMREQGESK